MLHIFTIIFIAVYLISTIILVVCICNKSCYAAHSASYNGVIDLVIGLHLQ